MAKAPLTDTQVYDLFTASLDQLNGATGATPFGETTMRTAERVLGTLRFGILLQMEGISAESLIPKKG